MLKTVLLCLAIAAGCLLAGKVLFHYFQLESYQFPGYFRTVKRNLMKALLPGICMTGVLILALLIVYLTSRAGISDLISYPCAILAVTAGGFLTGKLFSEKRAKKAFVLTARVRRLYAVSLVVLTVILMLAACHVDPSGVNGNTGARLATAVLVLFPAFLPLWTALCGLLAWPIEKAISEMYFRDAQRILRSRKDLIRIGVTGSWGKTSVKFILGTILEEKYHTLVTPASYNTPMGVTKVIRSSLEPGHRVFVAEMGARHVGDIREMCRLVHPQIGILTSVGPQHLDTFKTVERVARTKYELIEALPSDGTGFFADDGGICRELYDRTEKEKVITGLDGGRDDIWAENIRYSPDGTAFDLCSRDRRIHCGTTLLGELNIRNILLCAGVAFHLGMTAEQIAGGIRKIAPIEHRLQLIRNTGGITVIDDAFNSNIRGAKQAFLILKDFPGKRIVVTPGMVELGEKEQEMNREFGLSMADSCDVAVLIGRKRSESIREGLLEGGFPEESIHVAASLEEATVLIGRLAGAGDTVLFENDLPDNYTE